MLLLEFLGYSQMFYPRGTCRLVAFVPYTSANKKIQITIRTLLILIYLIGSTLCIAYSHFTFCNILYYTNHKIDTKNRYTQLYLYTLFLQLRTMI